MTYLYLGAAPKKEKVGDNLHRSCICWQRQIKRQFGLEVGSARLLLIDGNVVCLYDENDVTGFNYARGIKYQLPEYWTATAQMELDGMYANDLPMSPNYAGMIYDIDPKVN